MWQMFTDLDQKKQGSVVYLARTGRAREAYEFQQQILVLMVDFIRFFRSWIPYLLKMSARAYISFKEFHQFEKSSGKTFVDFIKFENCIIGW